MIAQSFQKPTNIEEAHFLQIILQLVPDTVSWYLSVSIAHPLGVIHIAIYLIAIHLIRSRHTRSLPSHK